MIRALYLVENIGFGKAREDRALFAVANRGFGKERSQRVLYTPANRGFGKLRATRALYAPLNVTDDPPWPWIDYLSRTSVAPGDTITIYGTGFGYGSGDDTTNENRFLRQYGGTVLLNSIPIGAIIWGWEEISIQTPGDMEPGIYTLKVTLDKPVEAGLRGSEIFAIEIIEAVVGEDYFLELKAFDRLTLTSPLVTMENATSRSFQKQLNAPGSGMLTVNRDDPKLVELTLGRIVKCYYNQKEVFAWVVEGISPHYVNSNMENLVVITGRGVLSLLENAIIYPAGYPAQTTLERSWTNVYGAVILLDLLNEAHSRGTITDVTVDFTATLDSNGLPWVESHLVSLEFHTGEDLLSVVNKLTELKTLDVEMNSSLVLHAYTARASNRGIVLEPVTGLMAHTRVINSAPIKTSLLIEGDAGAISVQEDSPSINDYGRREGYLMARDLSEGGLTDYGHKVLTLHTFPEWSDQIEVDVYPFSPFVHYNVGDYITLREPAENGVTTPGYNASVAINQVIRVMAITLGVDDNGKVETTLDLGSYILDQEAKMKKWLNNLSKGSIDKTLSSESNSPKANLNHNHDEAYSALNHNHDEAYSALNHNHDEAYSALNHNHDEVYAAKNHTHEVVASIKKTGGTALTGAIELAAGTNVTLTQDDETKKITIAASGSGGSYYENAVDEPPASPSDWDDEFAGSTLNAKWSWCNQRSCVATVDGKLHLNDAGTNGFSAIVQAAPTGDFIATTKHECFSVLANYYGGGIALYDMTNDKVVYFLNQNRATNTYLSAYRVTPVTHTSTSVTIGYTAYYPAKYLRARIESGTIYFEASNDGVNWITAYTEVVTAYLTSITHIGIGAYRVGTSGVLNCFDWFRVNEL
jgi:hypothetical protein